MKKSLPQSGFTLLELIVTVGTIAIISVVLSQIFFTTLRTNTKTEILKEIKQNGDLAQETFSRMIQNSTLLQNDCDTAGIESDSVSFVNPDGGETTIECAEDNGITRLASVSASNTDYLTSDSVSLGGTTCDEATLTFVCKGGTGIPSSVTISFSLGQSGVSDDEFETSGALFQTSATTRNVQH